VNGSTNGKGTAMNYSANRSIVGAIILGTFLIGTLFVSAAPKKTEAELIQMLDSQNYKDVLDALDRLPNWYPTSTNAVTHIRELLKMSDFGREPAGVDGAESEPEKWQGGQFTHCVHGQAGGESDRPEGGAGAGKLSRQPGAG